MIAVLAAMEEEIVAFRDLMGQVRRYEDHGLELYAGTCGSTPLTLVKTGIGKVNAAYATTVALFETGARIIMNIGTAGAISPELEVGDVVVGEHCAQHDVDLTAFGYKRGQLPDRTLFRESSPGLAAAALRLAGEALPAGAKAVPGPIVSGDSFVGDEAKISKILEDFPGTLALDMEAAAVSQVCSRAGLQFLVVRGISDRADHLSSHDFSINLRTAAKASALVVARVIEELSAG